MGIKTKRFISSRKSCSCSMPGVWRAVAYCEGAAVIFHSPRACSHIARSMDLNLHYSTLADGRKEEKSTVPLVSSYLEEKHSIFGGAEELTGCIDYVVKKYAPKCLVIANSCVAGVIGDDVGAVARDAEEKYGFPVLTVDCCGFLDGEYYQGYFEITEKLLQRFPEHQSKEKNTAVLIGDNGGPWGHYATEVTGLLAAMGIKVIGQFPGYMSLDEMRRLPRAEAAVILGGKGLTGEGLDRIAAFLKERFGIKYVKGLYPIGCEDTEKWLLAVGRLFDREERAADVWRQEKTTLQEYIEKILPVTKDKKTVLCIGRWLMYFNPAFFTEIIDFLKLDLQGVILLDAYDDKTRAEMRAAVSACTDAPILSSAEGEELLRTAELILTTHELQNRSVKQIFLPMLTKAGLGGEKEMMQVIYRTLCSRMTGGGITYV